MNRRERTAAAEVRLGRYLAQAGVASRRKSEDLIAAGLVTVNGEVTTRPGSRVVPGVDLVAVRGEPIRPRFAETSPEPPLVLAFHKPSGVLTARSDPGGRPTVYDHVPEPEDTRMIYVGRLDRETEGLLLFTTHGRLAHRLTHPRWDIERTYDAEVGGALDEARLARAARDGARLDGGRTRPFRATVLERRGPGPQTWRIRMVLREGRNREVRRIVHACGGRVERLIRTRYATVSLGDLRPGRWRWLARSEIERLLEAVDLTGTGIGEEGRSWS